MNQFANAHIHTQIRRYGKFDVLVALEAFTPPSGSPHFVKMTVDIDADQTWMPAQFHGKDLTLSGQKLDSYWGKLVGGNKRRVEQIAQSASPAGAMTEAEAWKRQVLEGLDKTYAEYWATFDNGESRIRPPHFLDMSDRLAKLKNQLDKEPDARPGETPPTGQGQPCEAAKVHGDVLDAVGNLPAQPVGLYENTTIGARFERLEKTIEALLVREKVYMGKGDEQLKEFIKIDERLTQQNKRLRQLYRMVTSHIADSTAHEEPSLDDLDDYYVPPDGAG